MQWVRSVIQQQELYKKKDKKWKASLVQLTKKKKHSERDKQKGCQWMQTNKLSEVWA